MNKDEKLRKEVRLIGNIGKRAVKLFRELNTNPNLMACKVEELFFVMDYVKHDLDLELLFNSSDSDFYHDVQGIMKNLNQQSGEIENDFIPRCTRIDNDINTAEGFASEFLRSWYGEVLNPREYEHLVRIIKQAQRKSVQKTLEMVRVCLLALVPNPLDRETEKLDGPVYAKMLEKAISTEAVLDALNR